MRLHGPLIACRECDLLQRPTALAGHMVARCSRCSGVLYQPLDDDLDRPLAYTLAATILFVLANAFPIVGLEVQGQTTVATLFGTARTLYDENMRALGVLVFFTTIVVPALQLGAMLYLLVPLHAGRVPTLLPGAVRMLQAIRPWGMTEVFILGLLVSLVKLGAMARVQPGVGLWSFGALLFAIAAAVASFDARVIWAKYRPAPGGIDEAGRRHASSTP
ncbi:MAG TPA: paraquat-inducible protein A [Burkholderiales bacterium]|nr:paraquat-inducible protein A [Burkholderiales bacterium]